MESLDCKYSFEDIEKILEYSSWSDKRKVDTLLHIDCVMYTNLGTDSSNTEKEDVTKRSRNIYRAIKKLDHAMGSSFLALMDKN
jgi:hypothetical protein